MTKVELYEKFISDVKELDEKNIELMETIKVEESMKDEDVRYLMEECLMFERDLKSRIRTTERKLRHIKSEEK